MESLRLCHPLPSSSKLTKKPSSLNVGGNTYLIPQNTNVQLNFCALHTNPKIWGENALEWNPERFIQPSKNDNHGIESEQLRHFPEGHYMPWSTGERVCPGKRFSQVELVATLAVLFRSHRVDPIPEGSESLQQARRRAQDVSLDIQMTLLNEMYRPERVGLSWTKRI